MKQTLILFFALLSLNAVSQKETRTLSSFQSIDVGGSIQVEVIQADTYTAEITMIKGELESLQTEVNSGTLRLRFAKSSGMNWGGGNQAKVVLRMPVISDVDASASAKVESDDKWECDKISIDVSSGASVSLKIDVQKSNLNASSGGRVSVTGNAIKLYADASSGAKVEASMLASDVLIAQASSGGKVTAQANESIKANASSGGSIKYKGDPNKSDIDQKSSSGGNVSRM